MAGDAELAGAVRSDVELIAAVRSGDNSAFGQLYERHGAAAQAVARQYARSQSDAEDITSDAFAKVLSVIAGGGGPDEAFRAYLFTVVRRLAYATAQGVQRVHVTDDVATFETAFGAAGSVEEPALEGFERTVVARAYDALPERWQAVLWYTEIEGMSAAQIAPLLGLSANGVAALTYRAREGLRQGYLQQHLTTAPTKQCSAVVDKLGAYVRGGLSARDTGPVETHLGECTECQLLVAELGDVNHGMRAIIAPLVLGLAGVAAFPGLGALAGAVGASVTTGPDGIADPGGAAGASGGSGAAGSGATGGLGAGASATGGGVASLVAGAPLPVLVAAAALVVGIVSVSVAAALGAFSPGDAAQTGPAGPEVVALGDEPRVDPPAPLGPVDDGEPDDAVSGEVVDDGGDIDSPDDGGDRQDDGRDHDGRDDGDRDDGGTDDGDRDDGGRDDDGRDDEGTDDDGRDDDGRDDDGTDDDGTDDPAPEDPEAPGDDPEDPGDDPDPDVPTGPPVLALAPDQPDVVLSAGAPGSVPLAITNSGPSAASDLTALVTLPDGVWALGSDEAADVRPGSLASAGRAAAASSWACLPGSDVSTVRCSLDELAAGATAMLSIEVHVTPDAPLGKSLIEMVLDGPEIEPTTLSLVAVIDRPLSPGLDLVVPSAGVELDRGGEPSLAPVQIRNRSPFEVADVELSVSLPPGAGLLTVGLPEGWSCYSLLSRLELASDALTGQLVCAAPPIPAATSLDGAGLDLDLALVALRGFDGGDVGLVVSSWTLDQVVERGIELFAVGELSGPALAVSQKV